MRDTSIGYILRGKEIGFVPTMGALHEGHLSLVRRSKDENHITVVSIFVNPIQFGPKEDYQQYPRDIEGDTKKLIKEEVDILFLPDNTSMYPNRFLTSVDILKISDRLCGAFRPGHFKGVATVVTKLFNIVKPTRSYFGQKDFQQTVIIKKFVKDLNMDTEIIVCPTVREKDGLAMSSRNAYLDPLQRQASTVIYKCLQQASERITSGIIEIDQIKKLMHNMLSAEKAVSSIDYAGLYDPETLEDLFERKEEMLLAVSARIGDTRLIDNMLVNLKKQKGN